MENSVEKIETEGFYAREYGLNVDVPKGMNDNDFKDYTYHLNRGMSKDKRVQYFKKPIPWEEGQLIAQRSRENPEDESLLTEAWEGTKNVFNTGWNQSIDLATSLGEAYDVGVSSAVLSLMSDQDRARSVLIRQIDDYNKLKEKVKADTSTAGEVSSGLGSVGLSTLAGAATYGHPVLNSAFLLSFGMSNYLDNLETMLKQGASIKEANVRALTGGLLEVASEKAGLKIAGKYTNTLLKKYLGRFGIEGIQELWQDTKDEVILGKYDTRTEEQKAKSSLYALMFGGLGGAIGFAINDISTRPERAKIENRAKESGYTNTESKEIGLSILEEDGGALRKEIQEKARERAKATIEETRSALYNKFIEKGDSAEIAAEKVQTLVPDYDLLKKDVEDLVREGFSENELEKFKADYDEAVSVGGDEAESYIKAKDELKQKLVNAGVEDEKADKEARMFTGIVVNGYQAYKDNERALGREPTKGFDEVKEEFYKLNSVINHYIDDTNEMWAEYDARNQTEFNEEQDMVEGKPSRKLYSKTEEELKLEETQQRAFTKDVQTVIKEAKRDKPSNKVKAGFGKVSKWLDLVSSRVGLNISGYKHVVDAQGIRHIYNRHGEGNEAEVNQIPVTDKDIEIIPTIVNSPNFLVYGTKTDKGLDGIGYLKTMTDGTTYYVEEVRDEDEQLAAKTLYKIEGVTAESLVKESRRPTSETAPSAVRLVEKLKSATVVPAFTKSLSSGNLNVKRVDENGKLYSKVFVGGEEVEAFDDVYTAEGKPVNYSNEGNYYDTGLNREARRGRENTAIVKMSPQEFLELTPKGMGSRDVSSLEDVINKGEEIAMPFLEVEILDKENKILSITGHEGRHRSLAMSNLGVNNGYVILDSRDFYRNKELFGDLSEWKILGQNETDISKAVPLSQNVFPKSSKLKSKTQGEMLGSYDPVAREVELFKGQNPSTLTHELGHHFLLSHLRLMESMGLKDRNSPVFEWLSKVVGRDINSVRDMDEIEGDVINPHEALVEAFISYMNNGEAPNLVTENIFKRAKDWLLDRFRVHKTEASTEIRDYFDSIIARDETIPDMSGLTTRTREIAEILKQAKNGEQVSFKGLGKKELKELQKAFHSRVRRKGRSLRDMIIERGGIKEGTELAKSLGFDVLKKDKMYTTKDTAFASEAELIEWLAEEGLIVGVQEGEDYSATERRWEDVQRLIDNAENTYTVRESLINQERETALANRAYVQEIVDELLKDNELGLKDINDLDDLLSKIVSRKDDVDITKVNSNAIKYLNERVKGLNKEIKALERNKNKEFKNKREEQYLAQNDLKDFIRGLPINNQHKVALMGNIQRVKDYDSLAQIVNDLKPRIKGYIEQEAKHLMRNNINNILIKSKPRERKKQNFNYDYNKLFEELREYNKLTQEQAYEKRMEVLDMLGEGIEFDEFEKLKNMFLSYKAMGADTSIDLLKKLSDELSAIYNDAVNDKMESDIAKAEQREEKIKGIVNYIENTKAVNKLNQKLLKMTNLNSNLSELFGKKWADEHKMDSYLIKQDIETNKALDEAIRVGKDIYKLKDREELIKLMNDMRIPKEEYTLNNYRDDFSQPISKMQLIDIYLTIKNKGSKEAYNRLYEDFDEEGNQTTTQIEDLLSNLTEEDKKFGDMLQKRVNDLYDAENKVYVKLYGIDMPKHENYWMRSSERSERELMDIKQFMNLDMLPSFMKERAKAPSVFPDDAFKKFARRMHDSKYMTEVFEHYKDLYDTIHSNRVKKAIVKKYDDKRYQALNQSLKRISLGGVNEGYSELNNILGKAVTNWVVSKISLSETVFVKQLASFTNYAENVPVTDFVKYQAEFWANPKKAIDFMKEFAGEYLDHRFKSGIQNEVLKRIMTSAPEDYSKTTGLYQKYLNFVTLPVRFGDIGAIYIGGYARAKYLVDQGVPLEKARKMFVEETESAQQSGNKAELSEFQENPLWRVFTAFKNTNLQYMRKMQDSYIQYTRGEIDAKQFGKIWGNYMVVQSILYQVLTNIGTWWRDDDDEELQPMKDVWMRILTSPVAGFPIIGDITEGIFAENYWGLNISGKQDMEAFIGGARDVLNGKFDPKKIAKGSVALTSFFRPMPDRIIKGVINLIEE